MKENKNSAFKSFYNLSEKKLHVLKNYIKQTLSKKWIHASISSVKALILFVFKKNETLQLCVNYHALNSITIKNWHSLSLIDEMLVWLTEIKYFMKLNLKNAYHHLRIKKKDEWKTVFCIWYSHFEYIIMSFDLANASAFFQAYINKFMTELLNVICVVYLNDILIYITDENSKTHWKAVRKVLIWLWEFKLFVNMKKCKFMTTEVEFLRFIVSTEDVFMNSEKITMITE